MSFLLLLLIINFGFILALRRAASRTRYKINKGIFWYHLVCFNLTILLLFICKMYSLLAGYPISIKFFGFFFSIHLFAGLFKTRLIKLAEELVTKVKKM